MVKRKRRKIPYKDKIHDFDEKKSKKNIFINISLILSLVLVIFLSYSLFKSENIETNEATQNIQKKVVKEVDKNIERKSPYKVQILNGCGVKGVAERLTNIIRQKGFDVAEFGNYTPLGEEGYYYDVPETIVIDRSGEYDAAKKIARILETDNIIKQISKELMVDVTIIIGKDYKNVIAVANK